VVRGDDAVDALDARIERAGLAALASQSLNSERVRFVVALVRIVTQLERLGDLAVNIAERAAALSAHPPLPAFEDLQTMAARVQSMVKLALVALASRDSVTATKVLSMDRLVDELHAGAFKHYEALMRADPASVERAVLLLSCSRHLERTGDHARNIAADVIWIVEDRVVRHGVEKIDRDEKILVSA
ncbi:MAG: phosphate signaling complex protein PhoU, partial [Planctomycetota bacterium]